MDAIDVPLHTLSTGHGIKSLAFSRDGRFLVYALTSWKIRVWDVQEAEEIDHYYCMLYG
jgi:WD40 repeat protein